MEDREWEKEIANSELLKKKIGTPYKIPENYFERLEVELHKRISIPQPGRLHAAWKLIPVAAVILLIVIFFIKTDKNENEGSLSYDELYYSGLVTFDENILSEYIEEPPDTLSQEENYLIESISEEALINEL